MPKDPTAQRVAFSPGEFAALFGRSQTWGYRQIYAGKVTTVTEYGRILIPAKEIERVLASAGIYNGMEKPKAQKARLQKLPEREQTAWRRFLDLKKTGSSRQLATGKSLSASKAARKRTAKVPSWIAKSWKGKANPVLGSNC